MFSRQTQIKDHYQVRSLIFCWHSMLFKFSQNEKLSIGAIESSKTDSSFFCSIQELFQYQYTNWGWATTVYSKSKQWSGVHSMDWSHHKIQVTNCVFKINSWSGLNSCSHVVQLCKITWPCDSTSLHLQLYWWQWLCSWHTLEKDTAFFPSYFKFCKPNFKLPYQCWVAHSTVKACANL